MARLLQSLKRRTLWIGFLAAFLPLLLILGLQSWWLVRLEQTSAMAGRAILNNFLEAVSTEVLYLYGPAAERCLDVPSADFTADHLERAAGHFRRNFPEGVKKLFVVRFAHDEPVAVLFYEPLTEALQPASPSAEARAVTVACAPWKLMNDKGIEVDSVRMVVEERDPDNRIILNPVVDETARIVGVAGMILDSEDFRGRRLPSIVKTSLPKFFSGHLEGSVIVTVRNMRGALVFSTGPAPVLADGGELSRPFEFVFRDWRLGVRSSGRTPEQWARASFTFNMSLAFLAAVLLTGGIALVLRTASREMTLSRMKSDFVSNVSHELRTPLASIRVFGELLSLGRASTPEKVREYGQYIESESRRLTQLINNILDFAKIEAGQKTYHFMPGDVGATVDAVVKTFETRLDRSGFEIAFDRPARPLPPVRFDPDALGQALHNLLDNAINYSGDSRWIGVTIAQQGGSVVVSVADRGIGISPDEQQKVFERFHRVGTGLVHEVRGAGLGLAIVHHIVQAHGGSVGLESEPGRGSTFSIQLPEESP